MTEQPDQGKGLLIRRLGTTTATLLTAGMIIGTGIFGATGAAAARAGSGILLAMILGGVVCLFTGISAAQLGVNYPKEGGAFTWAREFDRKTVGFVAGFAYLGKAIFSLSVISLAFAEYTSQIIPGLPIHVIAVIAMLAMLVVNMFDIALTAKVVIALLVVNLSLFGIFIILAIPSAKLAPFADPIGANGLAGLLGGAAIFFWTWDGFMRTAIMAGEVKEPRRTIPRAVLGGIGIAAIVFLLVGSVTLGVLGSSIGADNIPLYRAGLIAAGSLGGAVVLLTAWTASVAELLGDLLAASRVAYAMGAAKELPNWLGAVRLGRNVPRNAVLFLGLVVAALVLFFDLRSLLAVASVFTLVWYLITHYSATQLKPAQRLTTPLFTWLGISGCILLFVSLPAWAIATGLSVLALATVTRRLVLQRWKRPV